MVEIEWTTPAFAQLESLSQSLAFEIVRRVEVLGAFPEVGVKIESADPRLQKLGLPEAVTETTPIHR